jgi:hypothetical protein
MASIDATQMSALLRVQEQRSPRLIRCGEALTSHSTQTAAAPSDVACPLADLLGGRPQEERQPVCQCSTYLSMAVLSLGPMVPSFQGRRMALAIVVMATT